MRCRVAILVLYGTVVLAGAARAQQVLGLPNPRLHVLTPAGARVGSVVEVSVAGFDLEEPEALLFSHPSIRTELIAVEPPPKPDPKKPQPNQPRMTTVRYKVTVPADVPPGINDVRLVGQWGISNPRAFEVGDLNEVSEKEPNNDVPQAQRVEMNTTVTGTIANGTDVDYFVFTGKKGQRVVMSCLASTIDSRLQAEFQVFDSSGKQQAANRSYRGGDALTDIIVPEDGDYHVRLSHFTHLQGGVEYFYRLSISTAPWIDAVHPCVVEPGKQAQLTVHGRNLFGGQLDPATEVDGCVLEKVSMTVNVPEVCEGAKRLSFGGMLDAGATGLDGFELRLRNATGRSNPFLLTLSQAPVVLDNEANDNPTNAQELTLPCEIAGRVEGKRDRDWYAFSAKRGEVWNIELLSERLGAPTDMYLVLRPPAGGKDIELDDINEPHSMKLFTRTSDPPAYRFAAPADGRYLLLVGSRNADVLAGPHHYYRVRITPDQADFRLVTMPPSEYAPEGCCLRQGSNQYFTVYAWRRDGFNGEIELSVEGLPPGVFCTPQVIGTGLRQASLVITATPDAPPWVGEVRIKGSALIKGQTVSREARSASITWPVQPGQNIPTISRLDRALVLALRERAPFSLTATLDKATAIQNEKVRILLNVDRLWPEFKSPLSVQAVLVPQNPNQPGELPANLTVNNNQPVNVAPDKTDATVPVEIRPNVLPGVYNLVLKGTAQIPYSKDPMAKQKPNVSVTLPATPVTLAVLPRQVANVTVATPNTTVKAGAETEILVRVSRLFDYAGEFKVQLVLPPNTTGIDAEEATIPAGKNEIKLKLRADADAEPGNRANLLLRASAKISDAHTAVQETKINVNIVR